MGGSCCILGNGPSLRPETIPRDMLLIGVNRSPEVCWAPILVSADWTFMKSLIPAGPVGPPVCLTVLMGNAPGDPKDRRLLDGIPRADIIDDAPKLWRSFSGLFAMWYATQVLDFTSLFLLGFDYGFGHFHGEDRCDRTALRDKVRRFYRAFPRVNYWRYCDTGWFLEHS